MTISAPEQHEYFLKGEGDHYFQRNKDFIVRKWDEKGDIPLRLIRKHRLKPRHVLDIGAANGFRLEKIRQITGARCCAVEPSQEALNDGRSRYPKLHFHRGVVSQLPPRVCARQYDLVIVQFVLHWVGRNQLFNALAMIDRVVKPDGFLILGDFLPPEPEKVPYHHIKGRKAWTYKQDYGRLFEDSCLYQRMERVAATHGSGGGSASSRTAVSLLRKRPVYLPKQLDLK